MADTGFIYRQCITLRNGRRLCKPPGQAFKIPVDPDPIPGPDSDE